MRRGRREDNGSLILKIALIVLLILWIIGNYRMTVDALEGDPFQEPVKIRCTCYYDSGTTASGCETRVGIMAGKPEWMGCVAEVHAISPNGGVGEFIGLYEILDTGYGIDTKAGQSKIFSDRTAGSIEIGESVDIYMPTLHQAEEWIDNYGDYVYIKIIDGKG